MRMKKRGLSNLEMIISFLIFIGFLFFLFLIFPITGNEKSSVGLDAAERGIMNFTNSKLTYFTASFNIAKTGGKGCFSFHPNLALGNVIVKDENDNLINASSDGTKKEDFVIYINGSGNFYQVYSSSDIEERSFTITDCAGLDSTDFGFGLIREYNFLSYGRISELNSSYVSRYSDLHSQFNIPSREDFGFILRETTGKEVFNAMKSNIGRNVLSRDIPVQVLHSNGTLDYDILNIRTW